MPNRISNANIYMNGNNFVGRAKEIELPDIELTLSEQESLGIFGTPEYVDGIEPLEATITWDSFYPEWARLAADFTRAVELQVRASVETYGQTGRESTTALVTTMRAIFKVNPLGTYSQKEQAEFESELAVHYVKQVFGREVIVEFDAHNNIYKAGGVDLLAGFRQNLAL